MSPYLRGHDGDRPSSSTDTEMNPADGPEADEERRFTALGRYCSPEDIAATVAHLAGEGGRAVTGACIDAGVTA